MKTDRDGKLLARYISQNFPKTHRVLNIGSEYSEFYKYLYELGFHDITDMECESGIYTFYNENDKRRKILKDRFHLNYDTKNYDLTVARFLFGNNFSYEEIVLRNATTFGIETVVVGKDWPFKNDIRTLKEKIEEYKKIDKNLADKLKSDVNLNPYGFNDGPLNPCNNYKDWFNGMKAYNENIKEAEFYSSDGDNTYKKLLYIKKSR